MKWFVLILIVFIGFTIGLGVYLQPNSFALCPATNGPVSRDGCNAADAIVAISGGDTGKRTQAAIDLYTQGWAPLIIFSGAAQDKTGPSNAEAMRLQALSQGVPASAILIDGTSENTRENAQNVRALLEGSDSKDLILVTSGYHQRRASLEFGAATKADGITIRNWPISDKDWSWYWWITPSGWWLAGSEFVKVIAYYAGGTVK